jgi:hypothetical protein
MNSNYMSLLQEGMEWEELQKESLGEEEIRQMRSSVRKYLANGLKWKIEVILVVETDDLYISVIASQSSLNLPFF